MHGSELNVLAYSALPPKFASMETQGRFLTLYSAGNPECPSRLAIYPRWAKGSPISKAPVKRAQSIEPSIFCEWGTVSNHVFPRQTGRVTSSHPSCRRQRYQLGSEPHQSPIWIKAWERAPSGIHSSPWHRVPQTTVGSRPCSPYLRTGCLATSGPVPTPSRLKAQLGSDRVSCMDKRKGSGVVVCQRKSDLISTQPPQPQALSPVHPSFAQAPTPLTNSPVRSPQPSRASWPGRLESSPAYHSAHSVSGPCRRDRPGTW